MDFTLLFLPFSPPKHPQKWNEDSKSLMGTLLPTLKKNHSWKIVKFYISSVNKLIYLSIYIRPILGVSADFRALKEIFRFSAIALYKGKLWSDQATKRPHIWPQVNFRKSTRGFRHYLDHWWTFGSNIIAQNTITIFPYIEL